MWAVTLVVAAAPAVFLMVFFYLKDRYEREPLMHVAAAFGLGLYAMVAAHGMARAAESWVSADWLLFGGEPARLFDAFVLSGFAEELAKWVVLIAAAYNWDELDEPLDGVVYAVAIALGFAALENFLYVSRYGLGIAWKRALFAVPAHALFGGAMGFYAGRMKFSRVRRGTITAGVLSLLVPTAFHGLYNFALHHRLDWKVWSAVLVLSVVFWVFVLRGVSSAQKASPFRPDTAP